VLLVESFFDFQTSDFDRVFGFHRFPSGNVGCNNCVGPGGKMPALYGRQDARRYGSVG